MTEKMGKERITIDVDYESGEVVVTRSDDSTAAPAVESEWASIQIDELLVKTLGVKTLSISLVGKAIND